ncbi:MAG: Probable transmembrane protein [uncultured Rubrobacteraceae bacterium]|uniref:Probable transmembrane protein n=1 Tax=uncultured Rubrobacteraceae bacterium TaxID=349277 RepID=A0A6J4QTS3_9ACTN|nr:MAG: Probable transmembrane protein [uncultured Rubrobacteraceae bacterium]
MSSGVTQKTILRRDRIILLSALALITALSWVYVASLASDMQSMEMATEIAMPQMQEAWGVTDFALTFVMWAVMMVAMMTPSAAPMILLFAGVNRRRREQQAPYVPTSVFLLGYLVVWAAFSVLATAAQWGLHAASLLSPMMVSTTPVLGGVLLLVAGIYQWTPLKHACLSKCRSPLGFVLNEWREGRWGAFLMGLKHGSYCTGCCWSLMALLFVAGVMNLLWVAAIAGFILLEKVAPAGQRMAQAAGVLMVAGGVVLLGLTLWVGTQSEMPSGTESEPGTESMPGMESEAERGPM